MSLAGGYTGKILRVDLSTGKLGSDDPGEETYRKFLGGNGLGSKYLYDEVPKGVEWSDPANILMFFGGPLSGTKVSGSGTFSIIGKGPMTNMAGASQANGFFGAFLKFAGFDGIVVRGKANHWSYLYVHDGTAEIRDAQHLLGKDTWETEDALKKEIGKQCSVYSIGPAGEHLVRFAAVAGDHGHVAGHNGLGAIMGSKMLKAVVAERGKGTVKVAEPDILTEKAKALIDNALKSDPMLAQWGTAFIYPRIYRSGSLPVKNYTTNIFPEPERFGGEVIRTKFKVKVETCWACQLRHCRTTEVTEGPYKGFVGEEPEYEGLAAMSSVIGQTDPGAAIMLANQVDRLGLEINETGYLIGWIMECYEKGLLTKKDLDGDEMKWGDAEATLKMLRKIASREGCGDLFADGVKRAAEKVGGEALNCAVYTKKGASPRGHDHRARWSELIDTCLSNTGTVELSGGMPHPEQVGLTPLPMQDLFNAVAQAINNAKTNGRRQFEDSTGICFLGAQDFQLLIDTVNATTGWNLSIRDALDMGLRTVNQLRVFNFRHGLTKDLEAPSVRYGSTPVDGPAQGKYIMPFWDELRSKYYAQMGWDTETGKPTLETLEKFGLGHTFKELHT
jgi:aldehyde:ferredoxin oxidoreductase